MGNEELSMLKSNEEMSDLEIKVRKSLPPRLELLKMPQVSAILGISKPTISRMISERMFPKPKVINPRLKLWSLLEVVEWLERREGIS